MDLLHHYMYLSMEIYIILKLPGLKINVLEILIQSCKNWILLARYLYIIYKKENLFDIYLFGVLHPAFEFFTPMKMSKKEIKNENKKKKMMLGPFSIKYWYYYYSLKYYLNDRICSMRNKYCFTFKKTKTQISEFLTAEEWTL